MWSVWKHCMKYLCILWFWWHKREVLLQFKLSSDSGGRNWRTYVKCFKWFWLPFQQQTGCFLYTKAQTVKRSPDVQILDYWKMYRNQVTNSYGIVFMVGIFLKEILLYVVIILSSPLWNQTEYLIYAKLLCRKWLSQYRSAVGYSWISDGEI